MRFKKWLLTEWPEFASAGLVSGVGGGVGGFDSYGQRIELKKKKKKSKPLGNIDGQVPVSPVKQNIFSYNRLP